MYRENWKNGMNLVHWVYLLNDVIGVNGAILIYVDEWDEFWQMWGVFSE